VFSSVFVSKTFPLQLDDPASITGLSLPSVGAPAPEEAVLTASAIPGTVRRGEAKQVFAAPTKGPTATATPESPYEFYVVQTGDTASSIALRFGISLQYLLWNNVELSDGDVLAVGHTLIVPSGNGIIHYVRLGETLSDIAARYGVTIEDILAWPGNGLINPDQVVEDQLVFVPGGAPPAPVLPDPTPVPEPTATEAYVEAGPTSVPVAPTDVPPPPPVVSSGLIWPVTGPISSYMDGSHPLGIDIDLYSDPYAGIVASTSGTVTFAGGNPCCSYGLYVVIVSPDGIETLYAHQSSIAVSAGQQVSQGQFIGNVGCTGYCTGNHLHFEVIDNGIRVNPLSYLP
jgi:murein DD-endopeptidase MepM/ murein hydrolase activator NlpD